MEIWFKYIIQWELERAPPKRTDGEAKKLDCLYSHNGSE